MSGFIYTKNQYKISLSIPGVGLDSQSWDSWSGAEHSADTQNYPPGAMAPSIATGGVSKRGRATLERADDDTLIGLRIALDGAVNLACTVGITPLKTAKTTAGNQITMTGVVNSVTLASGDSTSSDVRKIQVMIELNETITGG
jgi:hypothetical protein